MIAVVQCDETGIFSMTDCFSVLNFIVGRSDKS